MYTLIEQTCSFTGYRPQKLQWGFNELDERYLKTKRKVTQEIEKAIQRGYQTFISGMALGFDMMCSKIVLELKRKYPNIKLVCALPCRNQDKAWNDRQKKQYQTILKQADLTLCAHDRYTKNCMEERNRYMVNNSSFIIALFDGQAGGTENTIEYAKQKGKEIIIVQPVKDDEDARKEKIMIDKIRYYLRHQGADVEKITDEEIKELYMCSFDKSIFNEIN